MRFRWHDLRQSALFWSLALFLFVLVVSFLLDGCRDSSFYAYGYSWEPDPEAADCQGGYVWRQEPGENVRGLCLDRHLQGSPHPGGCSIGCLVISPYSEDQARKIDLYGISLRDHEVEYHIRRQLRHPS